MYMVCMSMVEFSILCVLSATGTAVLLESEQREVNEIVGSVSSISGGLAIITNTC